MAQKQKIAFACQRYGLEVNGGSELHCRQVAERLSAYYDVTVYTTCAQDYVTWKNVYEPGTEDINGVHVKRFAVKKERNPREFALYSKMVFSRFRHPDLMEQRWIDAQGPYCPTVIDVLAREASQYKTVFFMTYLYYLTARGMPLGLKNAALIPTVHDEAPVYLRVYDEVFANARAIAWNTPEERAFANKRFPVTKNIPGDIFGVGIDVPQGELPQLPESIRGSEYLVYAGRIDASKGCEEMFDFFERYKRERGGNLKLVLMGKEVLSVPDHPDIIHLGFVSEEMKFAVMASSLALVLHSRFESLSMVVLESMIMGRPVLVSGHCEVLVGHCRRSNAGLYFTNYREYAATVDYLTTHPAEYKVMCENGKKYVEENYKWDVIVGKYIRTIDSFD